MHQAGFGVAATMPLLAQVHRSHSPVKEVAVLRGVGGGAGKQGHARQ